jgi:hypothetical protein
LNIPEGIKLYEHPIATFWFDDLGILYSVSKPGPRTKEVMDEYITFVKKMIKNNKVCILTDISKASPMDKETRDHVATTLQEVYKAMAIITNTPIGTFIGKSFLLLESRTYPMAMFPDQETAYEWLKQYL